MWPSWRHINALSNGCIQTSTCTHSDRTWPDEEGPLFGITGPQTHTQFSIYAAICVTTKVALVLLFCGLHASAADRRTIPLCSGFQARRLCARWALRAADAGVWCGPARCDEDSQSRQTAVGSDSDRLLAPRAKAGEVKDLWGWRPGDQGSRGHRGGDIWPALTSLLLFCGGWLKRQTCLTVIYEPHMIWLSALRFMTETTFSFSARKRNDRKKNPQTNKKNTPNNFGLGRKTPILNTWGLCYYFWTEIPNTSWSWRL